MIEVEMEVLHTESPASRPPTTLSESRIPAIPLIRYVFHVDVAHSRVTVPAIHRIYSLLELGRAGFVDVAGVDPNPLVAIFERLLARPKKLSVGNCLLGGLASLHLLERYLFSAPGMR